MVSDLNLANPSTVLSFCSAGVKMMQKSRKRAAQMASGLPTRFVPKNLRAAQTLTKQAEDRKQCLRQRGTIEHRQ